VGCPLDGSCSSFPDTGGAAMRNRKSGRLFSDLLQYIILELPKLAEKDREIAELRRKLQDR
jgi:hypothetical protein